DCSDGGVAVAIAECCFEADGIGADASIDATHVSRLGAIDTAAALFGESASRVVISAAPAAVARILERAAAAGVPVREIGRVGGSRLRISVADVPAIDVAIEQAEHVWSSAI